ncbi:endopeptidase La [[Eubacterium] rectale]|uniref:Lon protease n=1 Tax=Agathobacter rectalis TaxID=39491 RepID=A0AAW4UH64_9FIRM|nr:endopeptidase La [Agathobacter rectalis]MCB5929806.1 endopeptidase La [Agathobacter rectalis]MCB6939146.1 endopeptidase La [Agathobacter rectalis]MCB6969396.1 endopeptidase La [Agathobacter rectalis]MCQ4890617.1 endopeptidase La [Agathobacter rectalis]MCQ4930628.1 endopeptidase La [Agathobacter rectalis]
MEEQIMNMPAVALRGLTILPGMIAHFDISRERSLRAVEEAMEQDQKIYLVTQRNVNSEDPTQEDLYQMGIVADIKQVVRLQNDVVRILVDGISRAALLGFTGNEKYLEAEICYCDSNADSLPEDLREAMLLGVREAFHRYAAVVGKISKELIRQIDQYEDLEKLIDYVTNNLPVSYELKQQVLEAEDINDRYQVIVSLLLSQVEVISIKNELQKKVKVRVDKHQKEYVLREQLGVIREELGENADSEADEYEKKLSELDAPDYVKEKTKKEIKRFRNMSSSSSESTVERGYIETVLELPWNKMSVDNKDLDHAAQVLDDDHYGLKDVKERILEFLAVRNLTSKGESPIICLVGPPGTGKTSIARSIASALEKKYVRISLGGVRDEAEIRGHRKTYIGAMPGRIVNGLRQAGVSNPLMLLDEIDKVSSDYKGDTSAALLEVLDSEQNCRFRDHYIEMPVDLSEVLFIATANEVSGIPKPLLDRMELIEVSSYTENEKFHIAKEHLVEKQKSKNGIKKEQLTITDGALKDIIRLYTREAGVRSLERTIGKLCRKAAREIFKDSEAAVKVTKTNLKTYLGNPKYSPEKKNDHAEVGIVRGLAWTSVGGVTLEVEVNVLPGKGELVLTGKLGDVMKESAQAALSYVRSISEEYGIDAEFYTKHDIHIHIPEGAVPKDGPSAGITMATAMLSAITDRAVRADVAMTGEITLRGRVLPIGGLKEKLLAAKVIGIKTVCIPKDNEKDLEEISKEITDGMEIVPVEKFSQVEKIAFVK